jgi:hypothetical protein
LESFFEPERSRVSQANSQVPPRKAEPHFEDSHSRTEDRRHLAETEPRTQVQHHCGSLKIRELPKAAMTASSDCDISSCHATTIILPTCLPLVGGGA